jgi:sirohydrochlorin ferrochelatase
VQTGIVVFGHGSSVSSANDAVRVVADNAARAGSWPLYETAFLECDPKLAEAVCKLAEAGAGEVLVLPYFLTLGIHLQRDLPKLVDELSARYGIPIRVAPPLDGHPGLEKALVDRAVEARHDATHEART